MASIPPFFCELLPNIKSISASITLPTSANSSTRILVPPGSKELFLQHHDQLHRIPLPERANIGPDPINICPSPGNRQLSVRIPLATSPPTDVENYTPWTASILSASPQSTIHCRACRAIIVTPGSIKTWKDLPSGNWAEMMDFWHCHKPHEKDLKANGSRYATFGSGFTVEAGTGLVDGVGFLFRKEDFEDSAVKIVNSKLKCASCDTLLGGSDPNIGSVSELYRFHKWNIEVSSGSGNSVSYPLEMFIASQFLARVEGEGIRRLLLSNRDDDCGQKLKLWIFNPDIRYTHTKTAQGVRGIKIFWRLLTPTEAPPATDRLLPTSFDVMEVDVIVLQTLLKCLQESSQAIPSDLRKTGEWTAGMLQRFKEDDVKL